MGGTLPLMSSASTFYRREADVQKACRARGLPRSGGGRAWMLTQPEIQSAVFLLPHVEPSVLPGAPGAAVGCPRLRKMAGPRVSVAPL